MQLRLKFRSTSIRRRPKVVEIPLDRGVPERRSQEDPAQEQKSAKLGRLTTAVAVSEKPESVDGGEPEREAAQRDSKYVTPDEMVLGLGYILNPASLVSAALAVWRLGADMGLMRQFVLSDGVLSHWQVWFMLALLLQALYLLLRRRFGSDDGPQAAA